MTTERFLSRSLYLSGGLLIWAANFMVTYVVAALGCVRGFGHQGFTVASSLLAAAACAALLWHAVSANRGAESRSPATQQAIHAIAAMVAVLSLFGIAMTALVGALPQQCS